MVHRHMETYYPPHNYFAYVSMTLGFNITYERMLNIFLPHTKNPTVIQWIGNESTYADECSSGSMTTDMLMFQYLDTSEVH